MTMMSGAEWVLIAAGLLLTGAALSEPGLRAAQRIADATRARLLAPMQVPRIARGRGRPAVDRLPFSLDRGLELLRRCRVATRRVGGGDRLGREHELSEDRLCDRAGRGRRAP